MRFPVVVAFGFGLALSGCASVLDGDKSTRLATSPPGAECVLEGNGYFEVVRTPAAVAPPLSASPVAITCRARGFHAVSGDLRALFDERLLANFVFGSSLFAMIDLMNGRDRAYPERLAIHMQPAVFRTASARDAWFGRFRDHVADRWDRAIGARTLDCPEALGDYTCRESLAELGQSRRRELAALEAQRRAAHVSGDSVAGALPLTPLN